MITTAPSKRGGARPGAGRKPGFEGNRKLGVKTKVARIPTHWDVMDIVDTMDHIQSLMEDARAEITEAATRSASGQASNRFEKLDTFLRQLEDMMAGSTLAGGE